MDRNDVDSGSSPAAKKRKCTSSPGTTVAVTTTVAALQPTGTTVVISGDQGIEATPQNFAPSHLQRLMSTLPTAATVDPKDTAAVDSHDDHTNSLTIDLTDESTKVDGDLVRFFMDVFDSAHKWNEEGLCSHYGGECDEYYTEAKKELGVESANTNVWRERSAAGFKKVRERYTEEFAFLQKHDAMLYALPPPNDDECNCNH